MTEMPALSWIAHLSARCFPPTSVLVLLHPCASGGGHAAEMACPVGLPLDALCCVKSHCCVKGDVTRATMFAVGPYALISSLIRRCELEPVLHIVDAILGSWLVPDLLLVPPLLTACWAGQPSEAPVTQGHNSKNACSGHGILQNTLYCTLQYNCTTYCVPQNLMSTACILQNTVCRKHNFSSSLMCCICRESVLLSKRKIQRWPAWGWNACCAASELQSVIVHIAFITALSSAWATSSALCPNALLHTHLLPDHEGLSKVAAHDHS